MTNLPLSLPERPVSSLVFLDKLKFQAGTFCEGHSSWPSSLSLPISLSSPPHKGKKPLMLSCEHISLKLHTQASSTALQSISLQVATPPGQRCTHRQHNCRWENGWPKKTYAVPDMYTGPLAWRRAGSWISSMIQKGGGLRALWESAVLTP